MLLLLIGLSLLVFEFFTAGVGVAGVRIGRGVVAAAGGGQEQREEQRARRAHFVTLRMRLLIVSMT